jgi:hypothetical protein
MPDKIPMGFMRTAPKPQPETAFSFDLDRMKEALASPKHEVPSGMTIEEMDQWFKERISTLVAV